MKQPERFFGLHFDFHASNDVEIGAEIDPADIERYIIDAKPDFVQCDCKGHPGNSSYPTKVGKRADRLVGDPLRVWRDVTKKHGIPLYVHYSGVWDDAYVDAHPEDAHRDEQGNTTGRISLFSDYAKKLLIPQLKELIAEYEIDGVWIDGDCWAVERDYSEQAVAHLGADLSERAHNRAMHDAFLAYVKEYVDALHDFAPDFKVISNWLYTSYVPEKPRIAVDFISGDYPPQDSAHAARYEGRCIALRQKPWDLMAWGFEWTHLTDKPAVQLMQEAAMVLSLGGGFQVYTPQNADGSARRYQNDRFSQIGAFVRARRMLYGKEPTAQVALLFSADGFYHNSNIFNAAGATEPLIGALHAVLDAQYTANILYDYQAAQWSAYPVLIVPEWEGLAAETQAALLDYASAGGHLVVLGVELCRTFGALCHAAYGDVVTLERALLQDENGLFAALGNVRDKEPAEVLDLKQGQGAVYSDADVRKAVLPAYRTDAQGKGTITFVPFGLGQLYFRHRSPVLQEFVGTLLRSLASPIVEVDHRLIDLTLQQTTNGTLLNLVNLRQGRHSLDYLVYDEVTPVYDVTVTVHWPVEKVSMPLGEVFTYTTTPDATVIRLQRLDIHSVILLEDATKKPL